MVLDNAYQIPVNKNGLKKWPQINLNDKCIRMHVMIKLILIYIQAQIYQTQFTQPNANWK